VLTRVGLGQGECEHRHGEHYVRDLDSRGDSSRRLVANEERFGDASDPHGEVGSAWVVPVRSDQVDQGRRCDGLVGNGVEEVVQASIGACSDLLEGADVVGEHRDREGDSIRKVPVEAALADTRAPGDGIEGSAQTPLGEDLAGGGENGAAIIGPGARTTVGFWLQGHWCSVLPDNGVRYIERNSQMAKNSGQLTGDSSVGTWLDDPIGGPIMAALLAQGGQDTGVLRPIRRLALKRLIKLSNGMFTAAMIDDLVVQAAAGQVPAGASPTIEVAQHPEPEIDAVERPDWVEKTTPGRFTGKTVIVTGAGSGIGRATASRVAREGGRVIAVDISQERLDEFANGHRQSDVTVVAGDITDDAAIAAVVAAAGSTIDALANVAGIMDDMTPVHEVTDDVWQRVFRINVEGTMKLMRAVVPSMLAHANGSIVNIASEAALRGSAAGVAYTASKHAVVGLTKNSAFMYGPSGIRINAVAPGPTITNIQAKFASKLGADRVQLGMAVMTDAVEADALAASITFLLSDDAVNLNGVILPSDGGWSVA
jgi:NAD(P)-dependent dehydrogenase (short-subunit alcohol dehydrogenase family)